MRRRLSALAAQRLTPPRLLVLSFLGLIVLGTLGLRSLPGLYVGEPLSWLDALFTATSAVCVTGLIVVDTAGFFTLWGQAYLLVLIQLGGLGILTFATLALLALGRRLSLHQQALATQPAEVVPELRTGDVVRTVVAFAFLVEGGGAALLFLTWRGVFPLGDAVWHSVFHAVSAFCNAGFSTFSDSLVGFNGSPGTLLIVMSLIVMGGLGFLTVEEIRLRLLAGRAGPRAPLSLHSRLALCATALLLVSGGVLYALLEWRGVLAAFPPGERVLNGFFMSVTARTAGFNTVDYAATGEGTSFLTILLMSVGGSPGSTAGGVKTTTVAVIGLLALARLRGSQVSSVWGRSLPEETVQRAVGLLVLAFGAVTLGILFLLVLEGGPGSAGPGEEAFLDHMFEMVSAFNTVGLSMGVTSNLSPAAQALIVVFMFLGRVGPITVAMALARERPPPGRLEFRYAYENVMIG